MRETRSEGVFPGRGVFLREGKRVLADVHFSRGALAGLGDLRAAGATIVEVSRRYQTVTVASRPVGLPELEAVRRVEGVNEVLAPIVRAADCGGAMRSEGDGQLNAAVARSAFALDGSGVTVGILSDSFDRKGTAITHAAGDVASGDLPGPASPCGSQTPVAILDDSANGGDEGRAMAQIVHDLAPGAALSFATAFNGQTAFANNIRALHASGARVIVDDVFYPDEPFFQDGPIAVAIGEVAAAGSAYFSAAGNDNLIDAEGRDIASWEAPEFRDSGGCPAELKAVLPEAEHCMDFDPGPESDDTFGLTVSPGVTLAVDLQWAEPWFGVQTDLDTFLLDETGKPLEEEVGEEKLLIGSGKENVKGTQRPIEFFKWKNETGEPVDVQLAINRCAGECNPEASASEPARLKFALLQNGGGVTASEYPESAEGDIVGPTIYGHAGSTAATTLGAIRYNASTAPEDFSSRGPLTHYFGPVKGTAPAAPIGPTAIAKPDLVATDGGANTFFGQFFAGAWRFLGTSAAAPHAAAVAALMKQANPALFYDTMRGVLADTAQPVGAFGPEAVGAGLIDAYSAVSRVALGPAISITERPASLGRDRQPRIGFSANRPVVFSCSIDAGDPRPCSSPFVPLTPLTDGPHGFAVQGVDAAGRVGTSETISFRIDTQRPSTFFRQRPPKHVRTRHRRARVTFRFGSNESDVVFACKVDSGLLRFCKPRLVRLLRAGKHVVSVKSLDPAGNVDRTPAIYRFEVERVPKRVSRADG